MNTRKADKVVAKMVYLDSNTTLQWEYSPTELDDTIGQIKEDVEYIRSREVYDPTPSMSACNYCPLSWRRGGTCNAAP
jgi:CRISPR/Cas system-associated exonuclease Cas4 (RecB family)